MSSRRTLRVMVLFLCIAFTTGYGDGKFFVHEGPEPGVPFQRAVIVHADGEETLLVQSKWSLQQPVDQLAWIIPVPAQPQLASMDPENAYDLFYILNSKTQPHVVHLGAIAGMVLFFLSVLCVATAIGNSINLLIKRERPAKRLRPSVGLALFFFILSILVMFSSSAFMLGGRGLSEGIEVLAEDTVGVYDVKVITADESDALIDWLNDRKLSFDDEDRGAFDHYIEDDWCFVVATVNADKAEGKVLDHQGVCAPLILRFPTERPVYPMVLTATAGQTTDVYLYVFARHRGAPDERFATDYANPANPKRWIGEYLRDDEDAKALSTFPEGNYFLTKYTGSLSPEQMAEDLVVTQAATDETYTKTAYTW